MRKRILHAGRLPRRVGSALVVFSMICAILALTAAAAFANAANPMSDSAGTAKINSDGTVTVDLHGTWNWGTLSGSTVQNKCENRYGVGWAIDWVGVSTSAAPTPSWAIKTSPTTFFHVTHTMDGVYPFTGPCTPTELALDPSGPSGPWTAHHVYSALGQVPTLLCVNMYDLHGSPGNLSNTKDLDPAANDDNSIKTNDFKPAIGVGYCFKPTFVNPINLSIVKLNDANGDGNYGNDETASAPGTSVPFRVTLTNNSDFDIVVDTLTDQWPSKSAFAPTCANAVVGLTLAAKGGTATCQFTQTNYSPAAGTSLVNTAKSTVHMAGDPDNKKSVEATSTVRTPSPETHRAISITKSVDRASATVGDTLTYHIVVKNTGDVQLTNVVLTDPIPNGTSYVDGSASDGGAYDSSAKKLTWTIGDLAVGASADRSFRVTIDQGTQSKITNVATVCANDVPCKQASVTTSIVAVLGEKISAASLPKTGTSAEKIALLLVALALIGSGRAFHRDPEKMKI